MATPGWARRVKQRLPFRRRGNPLFDADWYLRTYPDVAESGMDPYLHYRTHGAREGRDPCPFLDRDWYLARYPDVAARGMDPLDHYYAHGAQEGRDPCPSFHSSCYLTAYPDVVVSGMNPLLHYVLHGRLEGRRLCHLSHDGTESLAPSDLYGDLLGPALDARAGRSDVIWFGIIDWDFRVQRPQHLASVLADAGHRIIYVAPQLEPRDGRGAFRFVSSPRPGVFQVRLKVEPPLPSLYTGFDGFHAQQTIAAIRECAAVLDSRHPVAVLEFPAWRSAALAVPGATIVMDCLDHVAGFANVSARVVEEERRLIAEADVVVASSQRLVDTLGQTRRTALVRNGADTSFFATRPDEVRFDKSKPIVGYFGAIESWFEMTWIARAAQERPDLDFVLIGRNTGADAGPVRDLANVHLLGEQPYAELPAYLHQFDVAVIPFKLTELIRNVNPVKLYEYCSAGVPVVASPMPELLGLGDLIYLARDADGFVSQLERAMKEDSPSRRATRREWAANHDWTSRGESFLAAIRSANVKVSIVVLCHDNWEDTRACLESIIALSDYPDDALEIIVVDNASTDGTAAGLAEFSMRHASVTVVSNAENLGFAGGNNVGIRQATGDIVILVNNDTYVTRGWVRRLIRPLLRDDGLGLTGPLTNNIGNEQKVALKYVTMDEMQEVATRFVDERLGETLETDNLAFFCVAIRRDVIEDVGLLDEDYGVGYFEDDDYCRRVRQKGWRMAIVDDVFIHHRLSASFDALGQEARQELFERNRRIYEGKWGPWQPHRYRDAPGFGA
jgi:GT2 family glycosyltransferase